MQTDQLAQSLTTLFGELVRGAPTDGAFMLNAGDSGLLASLDRLSAEAASRANDGATIAAHVAHLSYGLSLMNRWAAGEENPFADADWADAWKTTRVTDAEWNELRHSLRDESDRWLDALGRPRDLHAIELNGMIGSIAHLAYHLGAIRQIDHALQGPRATD